MNKLFAIAFTCIYLLLSVGVAKTTHYCMGRAKSANFFTYEAKKCACSLYSSENNGCCHDEAQYFILSDDQSPAPSVGNQAPELLLLLDNLNGPSQTIVHASTQYFKSVEVHRPPLIPLYKANCAYMFYDDGEIA